MFVVVVVDTQQHRVFVLTALHHQLIHTFSVCFSKMQSVLAMFTEQIVKEVPLNLGVDL